MKKCETCNGTGKVEVCYFDEGWTSNCHECIGTGEVENVDEEAGLLPNTKAALKEFIELGENGRNITKDMLNKNQ